MFYKICGKRKIPRNTLKIGNGLILLLRIGESIWLKYVDNPIILFHSCISSDLERVREGLGDKVSFIFQFLAQFIAGFTIGFVYGWKLALVMMSLTPLLAVCGAFLSKVRLDYILSTSKLYRNLEKWSAVEMFATFFQH